MSDQSIQCVDCGQTFTWSYGEQRYYKEQGLHPPKRCPDCRPSSRKRGSRTDIRETSQRARSKQPSRPRPSGQPSWWTNPSYRYGLATFGLALIMAIIILWVGHPLDLLQSWLVAITLITLVTYGYDKAIAGSNLMRVPERILLALTFAGGTLGAFVGMRLFRHKTAKTSFLIRLWIVATIQVTLIVLFYVLIKPLR